MKRLKLSVDDLRAYVQPGLYRHYDKNGRLLYVGETVNFLARTANHLQDAKWRDQIHTIELQPMPKAEAVRQSFKLFMLKPLFGIGTARNERLPDPSSLHCR